MSIRPLSNINISETRWTITIKFHLKHHWGWEKAALGFGADQIRTLVSITPVGEERANLSEQALSFTCNHVVSVRRGFLLLLVLGMGCVIGTPCTTELASLERLKKISKTYNGENDVITFSQLFLIGSFVIFSGSKGMPKSLEEFEFRPDPTTDHEVSCP